MQALPKARCTHPAPASAMATAADLPAATPPDPPDDLKEKPTPPLTLPYPHLSPPLHPLSFVGLSPSRQSGVLTTSLAGTARDLFFFISFSAFT